MACSKSNFSTAAGLMFSCYMSNLVMIHSALSKK